MAGEALRSVVLCSAQVPALNYPDNAKVIELLEKSPTGIFPLLDAQCKMPKGSDKGFCSTAQKTHAQHPGFSTLSGSSLKIKGTSDDVSFRPPPIYISVIFDLA